MKREILKQVILEQQVCNNPPDLVPRQIYSKIGRLMAGDMIIVISGLRRCGKSTLLQMIRQASEESSYYINFDDDRLVNFELTDFQMLYELFIELYGEQKTFYFDEIQNIPEWERFVRRLHDQNNKVFITGSNATMLSKELGTRLTGRHITVTLYPFSFVEFIQYKSPEVLDVKGYTTSTTAKLLKLFASYMELGGIPEYLRREEAEYMRSLYENIIYRDIIVRYKIVKEKAIKQLGFYLASNIGKSTTFNALRKLLGIGNSSTITEYLAYLENSFLNFTINRYSSSIKKQLHVEKKTYFIDHGLARIIGFRTSADYGRVLENIVFLELKRRNYDIYVHNETKECDFVVFDNNKITLAIQVCKDLTEPDTKEREYAGLIEAMQAYNLDTGWILTEYQEEEELVTIKGRSYKVKICPVWKWMLN